MKKLITCLVLGLSFASFAGEKAMGERPTAEKASKKKVKKGGAEKKGDMDAHKAAPAAK